MKKPTTNSLPGSASPAGQKRKYAAIFIVAVVAVLVLGALVFVLPKQKGIVGKAYQTTQPGTFLAGDKSLRFGQAAGFAAVSDTFALPVFMKTNEPITQIDFDLILPAGIGLIPAGCLTALNCNIQTHTTISGVFYPSTSDPTAWTIAGGSGEQGGDLRVFTLNFQLTAGDVEDMKTIELQNIVLKFENDADKVFTVDNIQSTVTVAEQCDDDDNDGYGQAGTDLRACGVANQADCADDASVLDVAANLIHPGATESCNGVDDNCDSQIDNGLSAAANTNTLGVCHGDQICTGATSFMDSYLVSDPADFGATAVQFTSPEGTFTQQQLYSSTDELCDFFDNNCDGSVNEDLADCNLGLGEASIVGAPPGNVFVDYYPVNADDAFADNTHKDPQQLGLFDRFLFNKMKSLYTGVCDISGYPACADTEGTPPSCGFNGLAPCGPSPFTATSRIYLCSNGVYYLEEIVGGNPTGTATRFSPTEDKQSGINVATLENCE